LEIQIPEKFNAAAFFLDRHMEQGRGDKIAVICQGQQLTYQQVYHQTNRLGNALKGLGIEMENRVFLLSPDLPELICSILGTMKIGAVPVAANTMLPACDIAYILNDSRAKVAIVHQSLVSLVEEASDQLEYLQHLVVIGQPAQGQLSYEKLLQDAEENLLPADTSKNDAAVWQYSSGTTGAPKGVVHMHKSIYYHYHSFAEGILNITEADKVFSVAKLFFGYGQGNGLYWPFGAGATTILLPERSEPNFIAELVSKEKPTVYCGVPTSYNAILQLPELKDKYDFSSIRACTSAGEALPGALYQQWLDTFGLEIIDGIGSTECFHIFISNRAGKVVPGSTGQAIPGFEAKIVDDQGQEVAAGEIGNLMVKGGSTFAGYWNKHELTQRAIHGEWVKTGDKFYTDQDGNYWFAGRGDDMIKAGGIWVSPIEVEGILISHPSVLECGVIGAQDQGGLIKPKAFVVLKEGFAPGEQLTRELQDYVKQKAAPYKYPRWIEYLSELPKTPTGKLQRFKLRELNAGQRGSED
jgi:benzoate-CoA ligase